MSKTPRLTELQRALLIAACARDDGSLLPLANSIGERTSFVDKAIAALVRRGLATTLYPSGCAGIASIDDPVEGVRISDAGRAAVGVADMAADNPEDGEPSESLALPPKTTKASQILAMLQRESGATLEELVAATGWLPHTTRAALTGLRKKGHALTSEKHDGVRRYRIVTAETRAAQ